MFDLRPILLAHGILLSLLAVLMMIPMGLDLLIGNDDWQVFAQATFITGFAGGILYLTNRGYKGTLSIRQAFIFTTSSYLIVTFFAALPFYFSDLEIRMVDAIFESSSGITTTGSTILVGLDNMPPGVLLWRSLLNALGGVGIVVMALAILPMLQIGGMQLFRTESSDTSEKVLPRVTQLAVVITTVYVCIVLLCTLAYWLAGMNGFDAINHAMTTTASGGFSTHDASIAFYQNPMIHWIAIVFMISGALPIILYYQMLRGNPMALIKNTQVRWFFAIVAAVTAIVAVWVLATTDYPIEQALRESLFSVVSIITTTGYTLGDHAAWGSFTTCIFFMLTVVGGCTGSTAGGIKVFRFQILYESTNAQVNRLIHPHGVFIPRYNGKPIPEAVSSSVMSFIILFGLSFTVLAVAMSLYGLDFLTAMSASAQALSNVGPGLGSIIGPTGNFATMPDGVKWLLSFAMIMGRLELFTVLVLLAPSFWRD